MKKKMSDHISGYLVKHMGEEDKMVEFAKFVEDFFENIPEEHDDLHYDFYAEVENFANEIDEEMIAEVIATLHTKEGTHSGTKWTLDDAKNVVKQYDVKTKIENCGKSFDCHKF
jgi:predicted Zn-dependent protease with MMP-like domain